MTLFILPHFTPAQTQVMSHVLGACILLSLIGKVTWAALTIANKKRALRIVIFCLSFFLLCGCIFAYFLMPDAQQYGGQAFVEPLIFLLVMAVVFCFRAEKLFHESRGELILYLTIVVLIIAYAALVIWAFSSFFDPDGWENFRLPEGKFANIR